MTCMYDIIEDINCACMTCNDDAAVHKNGIIRIRISYFSWEKPLAQRRLFKAPRTIHDTDIIVNKGWNIDT